MRKNEKELNEKKAELQDLRNKLKKDLSDSKEMYQISRASLLYTMAKERDSNSRNQASANSIDHQNIQISKELNKEKFSSPNCSICFFKSEPPTKPI